MTLSSDYRLFWGVRKDGKMGDRVGVDGSEEKGQGDFGRCIDIDRNFEENVERGKDREFEARA